MDSHGKSSSRSNLQPEEIPSTGLSVVYEPDTDNPVADIIMVHGLKGHPYKTWRCHQASEHVKEQLRHNQTEISQAKPPKRLELRERIKAWLKGSPSKESQANKPNESTNGTIQSIANTHPSVFWPADLLPQDCKKARILTFGYDTKVTKYTSGPTNMNSIFSHGKDFLFSLGRATVPDRPLIFVAHSLGGILVKEMLALSSNSDTVWLKGIVERTAAIIFMGTPHRGSPELSAIGEWARSMLSSLRFQTTATILDSLGLKTTDLERAHEAFSRLWYQYDFRVKTFQEGFGLTGINLGVLGNKVVPHASSLIGDPREHAETLQANHTEMSRFGSARDPNYIKVAGEIQQIYHAIDNAHSGHCFTTKQIDAFMMPENNDAMSSSSTSISHLTHEPLDAKNEKVLAKVIQSLRFPGMNSRQESISPPSENTGKWLFENPTYQLWRSSSQAKQRLLLITGKPGAGKSTIMKEAVRNTKTNFPSLGPSSSFFVNALGLDLERSPNGIFRSLLCELLPYMRMPAVTESQTTTQRVFMQHLREHYTLSTSEWRYRELQSLFTEMLHVLSSDHKSVFVFVDALDELDLTPARKMAEFWRDMVHSQGLNSLRVCLAYRHFPTINITGCLELVMDAYNGDDIFNYINQRIEARISDQEAHWRKDLAERINSLSAGVFLWVVLVVDNTLDKYDQGFSLRQLQRLIDEIPRELEELYTRMISSLEESEKPLTRKLFQWATESARPLRLDEWHHILAFINSPTPKSLREWKDSDAFTENDQQLERKIKTLSRGLLEVSIRGHDVLFTQGIGTSSINVGAGSLDHEQGSSRVVRIIHETVYDFLMYQGGLERLGFTGMNTFAGCHLAIATTCLDYMDIPELDALVIARQRAATIVEGKLSDCSFPAGQSQEVNIQGADTKSRRTLGSLKLLPPLDPLDRVESWLDDRHLLSYSSSIPEVPGVSSAPHSISRVSQALNDYPALLLYSTTELWLHIELANAQHASLPGRELICRLKNETTRDRIAALQETSYVRMRLNDYLDTILKDRPIPQASRRDNNGHRPNIERFRNQRAVMRQRTNLIQGPRRPRSIASFGSAGSYGSRSSGSQFN